VVMFRAVLAYSLIFAILAGNFSRFFIYTGFEANQKYIAAELCVNRSKPMMHCNGKCYLAKKIKQAEEKEKKEEQSQKSRYQEAILTSVIVIEERFATPVESGFPELRYVLSHLSPAVFHPPQALG
jgi:hypothetical protein